MNNFGFLFKFYAWPGKSFEIDYDFDHVVFVTVKFLFLSDEVRRLFRRGQKL